MGKSSRKKDKKKKHKKSSRREKESRSSSDQIVHQQLKRDKAARKAHIKATETDEERRARRLEKKRKKAEKKETEKQVFGYTNESNPFGDQNLTTAFVWKKKFARDKAMGKKVQKVTKSSLRAKQEALRDEIEKVKKRREQREREQLEMEEMKDAMAREAELEQNRGWEEKEEAFLRNQAKLRSKLRIQGGREKAVDILAKNLLLFNGGDGDDGNDDEDLPVELDVELAEPYTIFEGLGLNDLRDLETDIKLHLSMGTNKEYWESLGIMCADLIKEENNRRSGRYGSTHASVRAEVHGMFDGKSLNELRDVEGQIKGKLEEGGSVNTEYWEGLLERLEVFKAKAYLTDFHQDMLGKRMLQLRQQHEAQMAAGGGESGDDSDAYEPSLKPHGDSSSSSSSSSSMEGSCSPDLYGFDEAEGTPIHPEQDAKELEAARRMVLEQRARQERAAAQGDQEKQQEKEAQAIMAQAGMSRFVMTSEQLYKQEASKPVHKDEKVFSSSDEVEVAPDQPYWWHDKYRPRKPRYFNRVKTGYEWNKYNQTHYDKENPPPKIVQGYKFSLMYPDLIDPSKPPRYYLEDTEEKDYCIIRFHAGPPYEDVAFKIVKKEWEFNHKRGFKCVFDRGVLQLNFNFKRYFYRR